mgnify:CR=1 FL=1
MPSFIPVFVTEPGPFQPTLASVKENRTGSHLENEVTSKTTPSKPIKKSLRQNMTRNTNVYNKHVKKHMKKYSYVNALKALRKGRNTNPAHTCDKDALIF